MRLWLVTALVTLACATHRAPDPAVAQEPEGAKHDPGRARELAIRAEQLLEANDAAGALPLYRQAYALGMRAAVVLYNAGCAAARVGENDEALTWLERAVDAGWDDPAALEKDADLAPLQGLPGMKALHQRIAAVAARQDAALRDELIAMAQEDQKARSALMGPGPRSADALARLAEVDQKNTARMRELIAAHGWPTRTLVGARAAKAAWLLVQHADRDRAFQREMLPLLEEAVAAGEADPASLAYLTDRVRVGEGQPQRYGTQFRRVEGVHRPAPIEEAERVDERRAALGLPPLADYARELAEMTGQPASPEPLPAGTAAHHH